MLIRIRLWLAAASALTVLGAQGIYAQIGNDNPTGPSGMFNGNVTTGCSYDPYTSNARRTITDIVVAGSVGAYPLAFTRVANSRGYEISTDYQFGEGGWWRHSYSWYVDVSFGFAQPTQYNVAFPDGRFLVFTPSDGDSCFRASPGVRERFLPLDFNTMLAYLLLPDGGKVEFTASPFYSPFNGYRYEATAIIDPYGQRTTLTYNGDGSLNTVQEPGGRWLQLIYRPDPWQFWVGYPEHLIDYVQASDGRIVQYNYDGGQFGAGYTYLTSVVYPADPGMPSPTAYYTYQGPNAPDYQSIYQGAPLLAGCDDPMYDGPMKQISYTYATGRNPDDTAAAPGQILSEKCSSTGQAVSTLTVNGDTRTETRGDGPSRAFNYSGGKLINYSDFKGQYSYISYDGNGYTSAFEDARHHVTTFLREGTIGAMSVLTHPDPEHSIQGYAYWYANGGPYYVQIRGDERGHNTYFTRDGNFRLTRIDYPDYPNGPYEEFTYNDLGQVLTHRMTSGGIERFEYDYGANNRGLLTSYTPPATESDPNPEQHPTRYYYHPNDRLYMVIDARNNATAYEYNQRGQITHIQHQDYTWIQYSYNLDGTLAWTYDENHPNAGLDGHDLERTRFQYDDYKRVTAVWQPGETSATITDYAHDWVNPLVHTTDTPHYVLTPSGKNTFFEYDPNLRKNYEGTALGTADAVDRRFDYDEVGNLTWVRDPRWNVTTFHYDARNRKEWMDDPIVSDRNSTGHTMNWEYDGLGNLTRETRADNAFRSWDYDPMNRLFHAIDWRMSPSDPAVTTTYTRELPNDRTEWIDDPKGGHYTFTFDALHRKTSETYPPDFSGAQRTETWHYDIAGNVDRYTNRAGATQQFAPYDNRNRPTSFSWSDGTEGQSLEYDAASRITALHNAEADIAFSYDWANRKTSETETIKSYGLYQTHTVTYEYDQDGNRSRLVYPHGYDYRYSYTNRNQLDNIRLAWLSAPTVQYTYDPAGNRAQRTTYFGAHTDYSYNPVNQLSSQASYFANGYTARYNYGYDIDNRVTYEQRNLSVADAFGYDPRSQVTAYQHDGTLNQDGSVSGGYGIGITYDANGNRIAATEACCVASYNTAPNNQYVSDWTGTLPYDQNGNLTGRAGWSFSYDAQNRLVSIDSGSTHIHQHYDPLNRIVARDYNGDVTTNVWDDWDLLEEHYWNDTIRRCYLHGGAVNEIVASFDGPNYGDVFYFQDGRGNTTHLTDSGNNVIEHYTYFPLFGQPTIDDGYGNLRGGSIVDNRFLFKGALYLPQAEIYDMRNRFFHPNLGRFMQSDPLGFDAGDMNLFRYCGNDPVNGSDPTGEIAPAVAAVLRTVALNAAAGAGIDLGAQLWANGGDFHAVNWREVGISGAVGAVGGGAAFAIEKQVGSLALRLVLNSAAGATLGAGGQMSVNVASGKPWHNNVVRAFVSNGVLSLVGAAFSEVPALQAARATRAWNAATVEKRAFAISNAITSFTDNATIWPGVAQGVGIGLTNAYPLLDNPFEGRPDEPSSTSLQDFGGYNFADIFRAGLYQFDNPLLNGVITIGDATPDYSTPDHY